MLTIQLCLRLTRDALDRKGKHVTRKPQRLDVKHDGEPHESAAPTCALFAKQYDFAIRPLCHRLLLELDVPSLNIVECNSIIWSRWISLEILQTGTATSLKECAGSTWVECEASQSRNIA